MKEKKMKLVNVPENLAEKYTDSLNNDPKYSLEVDPENHFDFKEEDKSFIKLYVELKNFVLVSTAMKKPVEEIIKIHAQFSVQEEIRRINKALFHRQIAQKMLNLQGIGGYVTSLLMDQVPVGAQLNPKDKLKAAQILVDINKLQMEAIDKPEVIAEKDFSSDLSNLSLETIRQLIDTNDKIEEKKDIINKLNIDNKLSEEEISYLKTLSIPELLDLWNSIKGEKE